MAHRSRIRRMAKWTGVVVCVVLLAGSIVSGRGGVGYTFSRTDGSNLQIGAVFGAIVIANYSADGIVQLTGTGSGFAYASLEEWHFEWLPWADRGGGKTTIVCPLWIILIAIGLPTAYLFRRDRRHPRGHCQGCGYDLRGNVSGVCPECGRESSRLSRADSAMRRRSRRRIVKWTSGVLCVALLATWPLSFSWALRCQSWHLGANLHKGALMVTYHPGATYITACRIMPFLALPFAPGWLPGYERYPGYPSAATLWIPVWMLFVVVALPTAYLFYRDRRYPRGHCQGCGYNLKGNISGTCPECGKVVEAMPNS